MNVPIEKDSLNRHDLEREIALQAEEMTGIVTKLFAKKDSNWFSGVVEVKDENRRIHGYKICGFAENLRELNVGVHIRFTAALVKGSQYGEQLQCVSSVRVSVRKDTKTAIVAYLSSSLFPSLDWLDARRIVREYGTDAIREIMLHSDSVKREMNLTDAQMDELSREIGGADSVQTIRQRFPHMTDKDVMCCLALYGNADSFIRDMNANPYCLLLVKNKIKERIYSDRSGILKKQFKGYSIPFGRVDEIARLDCNVPLDHEDRILHIVGDGIRSAMRQRRVTYLIWNEHADDGMEDIYDLMRRMNHPSHPLPENYTVTDLHRFLYTTLGRTAFDLIRFPEEGAFCYHLYIKSVRSAEQRVADNVRFSLHRPNHASLLPKLASWISGLKNSGKWMLNKEQEAAIGMVFSHSMSFVCGGPGRGKTYWVGMMLAAWQSLVSENVVMFGPTGRAVNRLKEGTGYDKCETAARFLARMKSNPGGKFLYDKVPATSDTLVIIDEASMFDMAEVDRMFSEISDCTIVFIGDPDQLPPIEVGEFLSQICFANLSESGLFPVTTFRRCMRTDKQGIVKNSDDIRDGKFQALKCLNAEFMVEYHYTDKTVADSAAEADRVRNVILKSAVRNYQYMVSQYGESQVLLIAPLRQRGVCCTNGLNRALQDQINPKQDYYMWVHDSNRGADFIEQKGVEIPHCKMDGLGVRVYDRVMNTKNHADAVGYVYEDDNPDKAEVTTVSGVYNGDAGKVLRYYKAESPDLDPTVLIHMDDGRFLRISIGEFTKEWTFGYAVTVHKSQGSEASCVIFVCSDEALHIPNFLNRNMLYTGVTRAKEHVLLIGDETTFQHMADSPHKMDRSDLGHDLLR